MKIITEVKSQSFFCNQLEAKKKKMLALICLLISLMEQLTESRVNFNLKLKLAHATAS